MMRPFALMMPAVTVPSRPKGLPMAITQSPTRAASESPRRSRGELLLRHDLHHREIGERVPAADLRGNSSPALVVTFTLRAFSTTWLLVRMNPSALITNPEPAAWIAGGGAPGRRKNRSHGVPS